MMLFSLANSQHLAITILLDRVALSQSLTTLPFCFCPRVHLLKIHVQFVVEGLIDAGFRLLWPCLEARLSDELLGFRFIVYLLVFNASKLHWRAGMKSHERSLLVLQIVQL